MNGARGAVKWVPLFPDEEISFILGAVLRFSATLRKKHPTEYENRISARLRKLLIQDAQLRQRPIRLDPEAYVYHDDTDEENAVGRLDLRFLYSTQTQHPWPYFALEAKRLHVNLPSGWRSLVSEYVTGKQGMMCFIDQRYAQSLASGGMLAYVFDGDIDKARASVEAAIKANHEKLKCLQPHELAVSAVLSGDSRVTETNHRLSHGDFVIYHLFISV